jgi:hypothetical protein
MSTEKAYRTASSILSWVATVFLVFGVFLATASASKIVPLSGSSTPCPDSYPSCDGTGCGSNDHCTFKNAQKTCECKGV